ncbi:heme exporter protein CcmB [Aquicella lusitana]|uniref:Heme exporter protein B n=1 Tax=Aquicella lusitana TaxID=254246 RepID=A0A370GSZ8_9COXI|nr:heme exporter protein CcmB [Aquicella lusitana]RDI46589.1 heme exporter protein B [Aquicella lusitana]VVC74253.1 Heme exporter protein B [Aquicella lusitana]
MLKAALYVFYLELILLLRRSQEWLYPLGFFVIVVSLFPLAYTPDPVFLQQFIPGCIWIAALLASLLSIENVFFTDMEEGSAEQFLLSEIPLTLLLLAKLFAHWLVTQLPLIVLTPLLGLMFNLSGTAITALCLSLLLGTPILTLIGSLGVSLTLGLRQQGVLLGLLILPLVTPVLIFGVMIVQQSQTFSAIAGPLAFLAGLSVFAITVLPWTIAATLRISLDN